MRKPDKHYSMFKKKIPVPLGPHQNARVRAWWHFKDLYGYKLWVVDAPKYGIGAKLVVFRDSQDRFEEAIQFVYLFSDEQPSPRA